jgi:hypothetical protein
MKAVWVLARIFNVFVALGMFYITVVAILRFVLQD